MSRYLVFLLLLIFMSITIHGFSQDEAGTKIELSKKTLGLNIGTGFFQHINMNLVNFNEQIVATSDNLIPINIKANFNYYFTPSIAIRFSSGFGFSQQKIQNEIDYNKIDSIDVKFKDESNFSVTGFPAEFVLFFQTPVDVRANLLFHFGVGIGYYAYNYRAEGFFEEIQYETNSQTKEKNYITPEITLSGIAQFFTLGFDIKVSEQLNATIEVSKVGWNLVKLTRDAIRQVVEDDEITYEEKYGYYQDDYTIKNGLDDLALSIGISWNL